VPVLQAVVDLDDGSQLFESAQTRRRAEPDAARSGRGSGRRVPGVVTGHAPAAEERDEMRSG
jgi:hypothetical protein